MVPRSLTSGLAAIAATAVAAPAVAAPAGPWLPEAASRHAGGVDGPFLALYVLGAFVAVLLAGIAVTYVVMFRRKADDERGAASGRPHPVLLGAWVAGAAALGLFAFVSGLPGYLDQQVPPFGSYEVDVTARQWDYDFDYPNGHVADTLVVPVGRPVHLRLASEDVIHGLSVPELRISAAILPDRGGETWFEATRADTFEVLASIFSGSGGGDMRTALITLPPAEFEAWMRAATDIFAGRTMEEVGELLYNRHGCMACHSLDGSKLIGPTFRNLYGYEFDTREGERVVADDEYIRRSILYPNESVIAGYEPVMTAYEGVLDDKEIEAITAWLKTLSDRGGATDAEAAADAGGTGQAEDAGAAGEEDR